MHLRMSVIDRIAADDLGRQRILEKLGYVRFGHGHGVYYRDGAYVDQYLYQMERETWEQRWPNEPEYPPLGEEKERYMFGPRLIGENGISLRVPMLDDAKQLVASKRQPEPTPLC